MIPDVVGWVLLFAVAATTVVVAGTVLARSGDEIATRTGLGGLLVGMLLLSVATSLPELATDIAAALEGAPDLAVGDLFGSSMANMAILAIIDLARRGGVWHRVLPGHTRLAAVAIMLTSLAVLALLHPWGIAIGWVGADTILIVLAYVAAATWMSRTRSPAQPSEPAPEMIVPTGWAQATDSRRSLRSEFARFAAAAVVILVAAPLLALSGKGIADETGVGQSFIGALLLAVTTSLPELVASLAAVRIGAFDLAVGNLFGSNAINMTILFAADVAYLPGPILSSVSGVQALTGTGAIMLTAIALAAVASGIRTSSRRLEPSAIILLIAYVLVLLLIWSAAT